MNGGVLPASRMVGMKDGSLREKTIRDRMIMGRTPCPHALLPRDCFPVSVPPSSPVARRFSRSPRCLPTERSLAACFFLVNHPDRGCTLMFPCETRHLSNPSPSFFHSNNSFLSNSLTTMTPTVIPSGNRGLVSTASTISNRIIPTAANIEQRIFS